MKIGIDARSILNPEKNSAIGVGHYTFQLISNLLKIDQRNQYFLFFDYMVRKKDVKKFSKPNVTIKYFPWSDYKKYLPGAYGEILGLATLSGKDLDVLHCTSPDMRAPLGYRGKIVCTFQDLAVYKHPELFSRGKKMKARYNRKTMVTRANKLLAVSDNTKNDLQELFNVSPEKITVVKNGVDQRFFEEVPRSREEIKKELSEKFKIEKDYILFVGTLEPIKNVTRLIQAFGIFKENTKRKGLKHDYQLVLGGKRGWLAGEYLQIAKDLGLEDDIKFLGYIEGDDLRKLYKNAKLFVMPSLYEGFGMTVLEAMACGVPSVISNTNALKEIAGDAVAYVDPIDTEKIADKIQSLIENEEDKSEMKQKGIAQAHKFSWENCAMETLALYEESAREK